MKFKMLTEKEVLEIYNRLKKEKKAKRLAEKEKNKNAKQND